MQELDLENIIEYVKAFLLRFDSYYINKVVYMSYEEAVEKWPQYSEASDKKNDNIDSKNVFPAIVICKSSFFDTDVYGKANSYPKIDVEEINNIPVLFGRAAVEWHGPMLWVYSDFIASAYFLISRYEEAFFAENTDVHGRPLGKNSWIYKAGYIHRPLVEEFGMQLKLWVDLSYRGEAEVLSQASVDSVSSACLCSDNLWKPGFGKIYLTHDIDAPFLFRSWKGLIRSLLSGRSLKTSLLNKFGPLSLDPYYTFAFIERVNDTLTKALCEVCKCPVIETVYFFKAGGKTVFDKPRYKLASRSMKKMIRFLSRGGAEFGLHTSYEAGENPSLIKGEKLKLEKQLKTSVRYNRHHFLRQKRIGDIHYLSEAGISDDFTMGYADIAGFRLGTCRPVKAIDPITKKISNLTYHPLLCMDSTLSEKKYMALSYAEAADYACKLISEVYKYSGEVNLLWHNTSFSDLPEANFRDSTDDSTGNFSDDFTDFASLNKYSHRELYSGLCAHIAKLVEANHSANYSPHWKILLLCDLFPPNFAPRMGYLCNYLQKAGHEVEVLTEKVRDNEAFAFLAESVSVKAVEIHKKEYTSKLQSYLHIIASYLGPNNKNKIFFREGSKLCSQNKFDLILCSTYRNFPLSVAARLSKRFDIPWVGDLRDIVEQYPGTDYISTPLPKLWGLEKVAAKLLGRLFICMRKRNLKSSSAITTISKWHKNLLSGHHENKDIYLIYNGFESSIYSFSLTPSKAFTIVYTGRVNSIEERDPSLMFEAIAEGIKNEEDWAIQAQLDWYCDKHSWQIVYELSVVYGLEHKMNFKGYVPTEQLPQVLNSASVILVLTNGPTGNEAANLKKLPRGVLSTKLFEALGVEKPILCVRSDKGEIAELLEKTGHGCAASTVSETKSFLRATYMQWKEQTYTHLQTVYPDLKLYKRNYQAFQFEQVFAKILQEPYNANYKTEDYKTEERYNSAPQPISLPVPPRLQIVVFNQPYPPNYGGVIDVFYKIKALYECGVKITLHVFSYGRPVSEELKSYCEKVFYYPRITGISSQLSILPYNVYSRRSPVLLERLVSNPSPILFDSLHSCYYLSDPRLKNHLKLYREANIEHHYFYHLSQAEPNILKKLYFIIEALKLALFQKKLRHAQWLIAVSETDSDYLKCMFPRQNVEWISSFHPYTKEENNFSKELIAKLPQLPQLPYMLYHGNLSVPENEKAALYLIDKVFSRIKSQLCVIAGLNPNMRLKEAIEKYPNIVLIDSPQEDMMNALVANAGVHLLYTAQATGLKLKLLHCLFSDGHLLVNPLMVKGSGLESLCNVCNTEEDWIKLCTQFIALPLTEKEKADRTQKLDKLCSNRLSAERIANIIS